MIGRVVEGLGVLRQIGEAWRKAGELRRPVLLLPVFCRLGLGWCWGVAAAGHAPRTARWPACLSTQLPATLPPSPCPAPEELAASEDGTPRTDVVVADCGVL